VTLAGERGTKAVAQMTSTARRTAPSRLGRTPGGVQLGRRLHRLGNAVTAAVLKSRFHGLLSGSVALLTVTGRRTGARYVFPVQYVRSDRIVMVLPGGHERKTWWHNLRAPAPVRIRIAGRDLSGAGQALDGADHPQRVAQELQLYLARFPRSAALLGVSPGTDGQFDRAQLLAAAGREVIVRIVLADTDAAAPGDPVKGKMKAVVYDRYGAPDVLALTEISRPGMRADEVLVRVRAASLNPADWHFVRGVPVLVRLITGLRKPARPAVLASDLAGQVAAAGPDVTRFRPGDEVFGRTRTGHRPDRPVPVNIGGCAEYACVPQHLLVPKPGNLSFEEAAAVPLAGLTALQALRDAGRIQPGQHVLINGASGGVGTFAVQLAKCFGAQVTGVCSTANMELVRAIGADHVIDYTRDDFTASARRYDLIIETADRPVSHLRRALAPRGTLVLVGGSPGRWIDGLARVWEARLLAPFVSQRFPPFVTRWSMPDLTLLSGLIEGGKIAPVMDRAYPLSEAAAALRHLEGGHARGKVVITV
jgi:deazaflavin-dependent oxidoreductase (nitroreductase family)